MCCINSNQVNEISQIFIEWNEITLNAMKYQLNVIEYQLNEVELH